MVTNLYLIRHGETEGSDTKRYKGSIDVPLSGRGIEQMKKVSQFIFDTEKQRHGETEKQIFPASPGLRIAASGLSAVYCSPLSRAVKSAEIIAGHHGAKIITMPDLRERSFGVWEGMTFTEIKERYPVEFEAWASNPLRHSPIEGESTIEVKDRVITALNGILDKHANETIAVVAHGGVNRVILCQVLGIPLKNIFRIEQDFAAINIIEFWEKYPVAKLINCRMESCPGH